MTIEALRIAVLQALEEHQAPPQLVRAVRRAMTDALKSHTGGT
jgi:hypothetical protein